MTKDKAAFAVTVTFQVPHYQRLYLVWAISLQDAYRRVEGLVRYAKPPRVFTGFRGWS